MEQVYEKRRFLVILRVWRRNRRAAPRLPPRPNGDQGTEVRPAFTRPGDKGRSSAPPTALDLPFGPDEEDMLAPKEDGDIVKCCVSERGASLLNDWLGGLLGLFFAIDELNADDDLGDEFKALESTPMLLGFQGEFKDHRQGRDP